MKYTMQKLFQQMGFKKTANAVSKTTAVGQYAHLMFENVSSPLITEESACAWVREHKAKIIQSAFKGGK